MDFGPLRALARNLNFSAHGLAVTVSRATVDETPLAVTGIWLTPITDDMPLGADFQRREARRVLALSKAEIDSVPRGTIVMAPELPGGTVRRWRVDGIDRIEADHVRVLLVPDFDLEP